MDTERCDKVIRFALLEAGRQDDFSERELGPIHLLKYVYLADLEHAERRGGETFTGARWIFYHYGPWASEVHDRIEPALAAVGAEKQVIPSSKYDDDIVRWRKSDDRLHEALERELPQPVVTSIRRNVRKYGKDTAELLHHVYLTRPMSRAIPRTELVFLLADPASRSSVPAESSRQPDGMTARQQKKRTERVAQVRENLKAKLAEHRSTRGQFVPVARPPRYDEVFTKGLDWLDSLGSGAAGDTEGEAEFDEEVWTSDTRGEKRE